MMKKTIKKKKARPAKAKHARKPKKKAARAAPKSKKKAAKPVGKVTHFYNKIKVAIVRFNMKVPSGTNLSFRGATTDFEMKASSMQYDHKAIGAAPKGKQVGLKVKKRVREGDLVYLAGE